MKGRSVTGAVILLAALGTATAVMAHGMKHNPLRHRYLRMNGIPAPYDGQHNPLKDSGAVRAAGKVLFAENCASCHGRSGNGHGKAAAGLDPRPPELKSMMRLPVTSDAYLMWTISEGGEMIGSAMPAFKDVLTETERWQVIRYMRSGFAG